MIMEKFNKRPLRFDSTPNSPVLQEMRKPQLMLVKYNDYGVRKLKKRLKDADDYSKRKFR